MSDAAESLQRLVAAHGRAATAMQALYPGMLCFRDGDDAAVAYADTGAAWVAAGPPLAAPPRRLAVARAFAAAATAQHRAVVWFGVDRRLLQRLSLRALPIGRQAWWHAGRWPAVLRSSRSLREQLRRARVKGVAVQTLGPARPSHAEAVAQLVARWQAVHHLQPMHFLVQVAPFAGGELRQRFAAVQHGRLVGLLALAKVQRRGWSATEFLRDPKAPNGTVELLFDAALRWAGSRGEGRVTLGLLPLAGPLPWPLALARRLGRGLFDFRGLEAFKQKLRPQRWQTLWLGYPADQSALPAMRQALVAFAGSALVGFGLRTALRAPPVLLRLLALLLLPWTWLLLKAPASWFPAAWVQACWCAFDLLLALGLWALARRWRSWLGTALAVALSFDAAATALQVGWHSWAREPGAPARSVFVVGIVGPLLAAAMLWGGVWRRRAGMGPRQRLGICGIRTCSGTKPGCG